MRIPVYVEAKDGKGRPAQVWEGSWVAIDGKQKFLLMVHRACAGSAGPVGIEAQVGSSALQQ